MQNENKTSNPQTSEQAGQVPTCNHTTQSSNQPSPGGEELGREGVWGQGGDRAFSQYRGVTFGDGMESPHSPDCLGLAPLHVGASLFSFTSHIRQCPGFSFQSYCSLAA